MKTSNTILGADIFDMDERIVINSCAKGLKQSEFTKKRITENLNFTLTICNDDMILSMTEGLKDKIDKITDSEWDEIKMLIPFEVLYDLETNIDAAPSN